MSADTATNGENGHGADVLRQLADHPEIGEIRRVLGELRTLSETSILLDRLQFARQHGVTFDGKRKEYEIFGYDSIITYRQYRDEYARGGIAGRVVDVMPDACWRGEIPFEVIEDEDPEKDTEFEKAWKNISLKHKIPTKFQRADRLSRLSTYSIILIGAPGQLDTELPRAKNGDSLLYFKPYSGGGGPGNNSDRRMVDSGARATIFEYDENPSSSRFGEPLTYTINFFQRRLVAGESPLPKVHWSRVIHVAEGLLEDEVFGQPVLERVWNLLIDLRKVTGGGAEAFFLRANQGLHLDIDKDMALDATKDTVEALKEQAEAYKHQLTRWLRTRGVKVETLGSDVANFAAPADAIITQIAGARATPKRILTGSEMGELASSQDRENWKDQVDGRQTQHCGPNIVRQAVDRFITYGYLPTPKKGPLEYQVKWPHIQVMTEAEKSDGAVKWSQTKVGEDPVFTDAEIRDKWYGMAPLSDEQRMEIDERKAQAVQRQQDAMAARQPEEMLRAAQADDEELIEILAAAIRSGSTEVIETICGVKR